MEPNQNKIEFFEAEPVQSTNNTPVPPSVTTEPAIQSSNTPQVKVKYAGFWIRYVAAIIDALVLVIPILLIDFLLGIALPKPFFAFVSPFTGLLVAWVYYVIMTYNYQATLGKKAFGIRVVSDKAENLTLGQVILRETIGKLISMIILYIGYIMAAFTKRKQALHDKMASTVVVYNDPEGKIRGGAVALIVVACVLPFLAIIGILASIVLVSLNNARGKAQDAAIKSTLASMLPEAFIYQVDNSTLLGYKLSDNFIGDSIKKCSGQPVVNISPDGKQIAIFMKSCKDDKKYFCGNPLTSLVTETAEVDESYVKSGAAICNASDIPEELPENQENQNQGLNSSEQETLSNLFKDESLGYEIKYPGDWMQTKSTDNETGVNSVIFSPDFSSPVAVVSVHELESENVISKDDVLTFIQSSEKAVKDAKGKIYDEKDFVYNLEQGVNLNGMAFKSELSEGNDNIKQWIIAIPKGKNLYWFVFASQIDQFDKYYPDAKAMLDSWKISK
jgi:uncharacterized RDD family membrane protein YckC